MAFLEFKDIDRQPFHTRFHDPGTAVLQLLVRDVKAATGAWKKAGGEVISGRRARDDGRADSGGATRPEQPDAGADFGAVGAAPLSASQTTHGEHRGHQR